jgi:hypothetical protein
MGGGDSKAATSSATSSQQLLDEFKKQQTYDRINKPFQQLAAGLGTQLPYMQAQQGQAQIPGAGAAPQTGPSNGPLGPLFQGMGGGGGIGGIDEQQLAMILQRLGYGG